MVALAAARCRRGWPGRSNRADMTGQRGPRPVVARPARMIATAPAMATARHGAPAMTAWPDEPAITIGCAALPGELPLVVDPPTVPFEALALAAARTADARTPVATAAPVPAPRTASRTPTARLARDLVAMTAARQASAASASALASGTSAWPVTEKSCAGSGRGATKMACAHACRVASRTSPAPTAPSSSTSANSLRITDISGHWIFQVARSCVWRGSVSLRHGVAGILANALGRFAGHRLEHVGVEAGPVAGVAGRADLVDLDQQGVAIAVQRHRLHPLLVPGCVTLHPVLLAAA